MVSVAVAVPVGDVIATAFVHLSRSVAHATCVELSHATVHVVAHHVSILVSDACPATHAEGIQLVSVAVAVPSRDVCTTAFVHFSGSVANTAGVESANTIIYVVTNAISIFVSIARPAAFTCSVKLVSVTVAVPGRDV